MNSETLACAIVGHLVGDYLLQNDLLALNKKSSGWKGLLCCLVHCQIWTLCVVAFFGWVGHPPHNLFLALNILFWSHFIQDRTNIINWWMELIGQNKFRTGPCAPWSIIVVDNVWHIVTIWAVWRFVV